MTPPDPSDAFQLAAALKAVRDHFDETFGALGPEAAVDAGRPGARAETWRSPRRRRVGQPPGSAGRLIYAVGDVHGRLDLLTELVARIRADAGQRSFRLVMCGDYIDRGPDSARVLEWLVCLKRALGPGLVLLKGNHEQVLLRFLEEPSVGAAWIPRFGGDATLRAYGVAAPESLAPAALAAARDALLSRMPASHLRLLHGLELAWVEGDYLFAHAGLSPDARLADQTENDFLWAPDGFLEARGPFEKVVVHGHTWTSDQPQLLGHRIGLDTGAYETGVLTAVRILDAGQRAIQALDLVAADRRAAEMAARVPRLVLRPADYLAPADHVHGPLLEPDARGGADRRPDARIGDRPFAGGPVRAASAAIVFAMLTAVGAPRLLAWAPDGGAAVPSPTALQVGPDGSVAPPSETLARPAHADSTPASPGGVEQGPASALQDAAHPSSRPAAPNLGRTPVSVRHFRPAFRCDRPLRASERMVCADDGLARLDRQLNRAFTEAVRAGVPRKPLRREQDQWVFAREAVARESRSALAAYYATRIAQLQDLARKPFGAPAAGAPQATG